MPEGPFWRCVRCIPAFLLQLGSGWTAFRVSTGAFVSLSTDFIWTAHSGHDQTCWDYGSRENAELISR
jgi:hypothetical protein